MDLNQISSIETLESLAYRQLIAIKSAEQNLASLETRMQQIYKEQQAESEAEDKKKK